MGRSVKGTEKAQSGRGIVKAEVAEAQRHKVIFGRDAMLASNGGGIVKAEVPSCLCHFKKTLCASVPLPLDASIASLLCLPSPLSLKTQTLP
ncbi:hypothetical protein QM480_08790 [Flectobacillus sp. DC10W]|uniref:Uncharacterized protein n=1 Tax=Flectobacillus longus TaxID=2984207 RepID=A0ABT6YLU2_9BACT|nr:hypothetical protein [Flectobacillus longus]MDI9864421.1 hypothetical protein [Flectobacillus longus]